MRLFSVSQFYHFAVMIISLAMLGFGASGTLLALRPQIGQRYPQRILALLALLFGLTCIGSYWLTNTLPFDSFSMAWDWRQSAILVLHYLTLAAPFLCSGAALALLFVRYPHAAGSLYASNLTGSALGCLTALLAPAVCGGEWTIFLCAALAALASWSFAATESPPRSKRILRTTAWLLFLGSSSTLLLRPEPFNLRLSPYKGLSYALQYPDAHLISQRWNGFSRVDVVASAGIRSLPGLSYRHLAPLPPQYGIFVDGDALTPALRIANSDRAALAFTDYLPSAVAYRLRRGGTALVLEARGGLEVWTALAQGATHVTAIEPNPLIIAAAGEIYAHPQVTVWAEAPRSFVRRTEARYDIVALPLTGPYRPIRSGAYSLTEDYHYTLEAFRDYAGVLNAEGLLVLTRWLQLPPSESLRAFALALTALEESGYPNPAQQLAAFRGYATMTILVKNAPFTAEELATLRHFAEERAFDLVYLPDLRPEERNRHNILSAPFYEDAIAALLTAPDRKAWYAAYPFDVTPPTDDHPFFGHFFKWEQAPQIWAELGKIWQPFGGAGYFVLIALLLLATLAASALIGLPLLALSRTANKAQGVSKRYAARDTALPLAYFGLLGLGFLLVEIPLMQRFILLLSHPAYAFTAVLFALLLFSGIGSALSARLPLRPALAALVALSLLYAWILPHLFEQALQLPFGARIAVALVVLAPLGILMGMPFPAGMQRLERSAPQWIAWAWGVNGATSVIASVLAGLLALSLGFRWVLLIGTLCYALAWAAGGALERLRTSQVRVQAQIEAQELPPR